MYCGNCGSKISENDSFCKTCGSKIVRNGPRINNSNNRKSTLKSFQTFSKTRKAKILLGVIVLVIIYSLFNHFYFSEDAVIKRYVKAYANNDYESILALTDIKRNEFMKADTITEKYDEKTDNYVKIKILSTNKTKKEHTRTVSYQTLDYEKVVMNLKVKSSGRKYLIFKKYIITSTNLEANDVTITVAKDSKLTIDNIEIKDKYKKKEESGLITYEIPSLLKKNVKMEVELENGIKVTNIKNVYSHENLTTEKLYNATLDTNTNKNVVDKIEKSITLVVNNALDNKDESSIKDNTIFLESLTTSSTFIDNYNLLKEKYQNKSIKDFKINTIIIKNINIENDNDLNIKASISYSYKDNNNNERSTTRSVLMTFDYENNLKIEEFYISNLYTLF